MPVGKQERERRWGELRRLMAAHELDAVIIRGVCDNPHALYFTDVMVRAMPSTMFVLTRDGQARMFMANPYDSSAPEPLYADDDTVMVENEADVRLPVPSGLASWLTARGAKRLGVPGIGGFPPPVVDALKQAFPASQMLDIGPAVDELRWVKSDAEWKFIRQSAASADKVWNNMHRFLRPGRSINQLLSDIDHFLVEDGCDQHGYAYEGSFLMVLKFGLPVNCWDDNQPMRQGDAFTLEISPRYQGYFTQLTSLVSIGPVKPEIRRAYNAVLKARTAAVSHVRAGAESKPASDAMVASLTEDGYEPCNPNIGHMIGLSLEEGRMGAGPFAFKAGMPVVLHPIIKSPLFKMLMRGDSYLVTEDGAEKLNHFSTDILEV